MSRILVIDDSDLVAKVLKEALLQAGYEVSVAMDANRGYAEAIEFHPDLIVLDVNLPDVLGFDLVQVLKNREELRNVPIVMITGSHRKLEFKERALKAGVADYILKPFEMTELIDRVGRVLGGASHSPIRVEGTTVGRIESASPPMGSLSALKKTASVPEPEAAKPLAQTVAPNPATANREKTLSLPKAVATLLLSPDKFPFQASLPPTSLAFLISTLAMGFIGLALAAGPAIKPAVFALAVLLGWVVLVSVLVMSCSVIGVTIHWKEGGRLLSLAMTPLVLKMAGGTVATLWTSLSPFYFKAGPAVLFKSAPFLFERFDIFEGWSAALLWWLLCHRPASSRQRAGIVTGLVWLAGIALAAAAQKLGG